MAAKKPADPKKAKDLDIGKTKGGEKVKGGATGIKHIKFDALLTDKHLR